MTFYGEKNAGLGLLPVAAEGFTAIYDWGLTIDERFFGSVLSSVAYADWGKIFWGRDWPRTGCWMLKGKPKGQSLTPALSLSERERET